MTPAMKASADLKLAGLCIAGDRRAQRELFQREKRRVHATLYRILGNNREMEDLVQESFLEVFRSLRHFRGEAQLSTWIDRIAARVAYAFLTRSRSSATLLEVVPDIAGDDPSAEERALAREAARHLYTALDRIEAKQRIAFTLHVIDGRPLREVAEVMESSLVATKTRVWRARRELEKRARKDSVLGSFLTDEAADNDGGSR